MLTWMFRRLVVLCAAICVLLLLLFPLVHGPFPATHGPVTAFRGRRALVVLLLLIFSAARSSLGRLRPLPDLCAKAFRGRDRGGIGLMQDPDLAVLRC